MEISADKQFKVTMMLADAAQVAEGKLNVLGAGWNITGPAPAPFAIGVIFEIPWHLTNREHKYRLELVDLDGNPVVLPGPEPAPLAFEEAFEVGRPAGMRQGSYLPMPRAFNFGPMPIPPGGHYEWRLTIDGDTREEWRLPFSTRSIVELAA
jgi:hypothetical protein